MIPSGEQALEAVVLARRRVALGLTALMMVIYFGFVSLIAWNKALLAIQLRPGLSLGILLGAGVIASCWVLTWVYVRWVNAYYDPTVRRFREQQSGPA